jgi:hypothetical protein
VVLRQSHGRSGQGWGCSDKRAPTPVFPEPLLSCWFKHDLFPLLKSLLESLSNPSPFPLWLTQEELTMDWKHCVVWIVFSGLLLLTLDFDIKHIHLTANTPTPPVLNTQIRINLEANVSDLPVLNAQIRIEWEANGTLSAMAKRVNRISAARCVNADYRMTPYQVSLKFSYPNDCRIVVNWGDLEFTEKWCDMHTCFDYSLPGLFRVLHSSEPCPQGVRVPSVQSIFHWRHPISLGFTITRPAFAF